MVVVVCVCVAFYLMYVIFPSRLITMVRSGELSKISAKRCNRTFSDLMSTIMAWEGREHEGEEACGTFYTESHLLPRTALLGTATVRRTTKHLAAVDLKQRINVAGGLHHCRRRHEREEGKRERRSHPAG